MSKKQITIEFPVTVTVEWPTGVKYDSSRAIEVALHVVSKRCGIDVSDRAGKLIFAECWAEADAGAAEIVEENDNV